MSKLTGSQAIAVDCAVSAWSKAVAEKPMATIVDELAEQFYDPKKVGNAEKQIKHRISQGLGVLTNEDHEWFQPGKAETIKNALRAVGYGKRGRSSSVDSETRNSLLEALADIRES